MRESHLQESFLDLPKTDREIREELMQELAEAKRALRHAGKLASLGQFCANLVHELNNPLSIICGSAEMAKNTVDRLGMIEEKRLEEVRRNLRRIDQASERMVKIVKDVLRYARYDSSTSAPFTLETSVRDAIDQVEALFAKSSIPIQLKLEPSEVICRGDSAALTQVWTNLLINAKDAILSLPRLEDGRVLVSILRLSRTSVRVSIEDNGCGMSQETQDKIFQPFFTTKEVGKGSGLGLSISRGIIEEYGGALYCSSQLGQGTQFYVVLPTV